MKTKYKNICRLLFIILAVLLTAACGKEAKSSTLNDQGELSVYFVSQADGKLGAETITLNPKEYNSDIKKLQGVVEALQKGPQSASLLPIITDDVTIESVELEDENVKVYLSKNYNELAVQKQMILRAGFVRTLTNLPFIHSVEFLIAGSPLISSDGEAVGPIFKDDIVLVQPDPNPPTNVQNITLYFGHSAKEGLVAENRQIQVNSNVPLERYILEELIKGPQNENYVRTVPQETKINDVKTKDGVCQVDLSSEFKSKHNGGSLGEMYTIYSIVNSLTESSPKVKKVSFLIDGKKQTEFKGHLDFSILFERDESLIGKEEND